MACPSMWRSRVLAYVPAGEAGTTPLRLLSKAAVMLMDAGFRDRVRESTDPVEIAELINAGLEG